MAFLGELLGALVFVGILTRVMRYVLKRMGSPMLATAPAVLACVFVAVVALGLDFAAEHLGLYCGAAFCWWVLDFTRELAADRALDRG